MKGEIAQRIRQHLDKKLSERDIHDWILAFAIARDKANLEFARELYYPTGQQEADVFV